MPNSTSNSKWYSTAYGQDSLVIESKDFNENDTFYLGVIVSSKCTYELSVKLLEENELSQGNNYVFVKKGINYLGYLWNNNTNSSSVLIAARGFSLGEYRLYVAISKLLLL